MLVSVDDALPLVSLGAASPVTSLNALRVGDPGGSFFFGGRETPRPWGVDVAVAERITVGGSLLAAWTPVAVNSPAGPSSSDAGEVPPKEHFLQVRGRAGYLAPLGDHVALWPRLGLGYAMASGHAPDDVSTLSATLEARLVLALSSTFAVTMGGGLDVPLAGSHQFSDIQFDNRGDAAVVRSSDLPLPTLSFSVGLLGRIHGPGVEAPTNAAEPPTVLFGVERLVPLLRYRRESSGSTITRSVDLGTGDSRLNLQQRPRLALDVVVGRLVTLGLAANGGSATFASTRDWVPSTGSWDESSWSVAPRVGLLLPLTRMLRVWPRAGIAYTAEKVERFTPTTLTMDLDGFFVFTPVSGFGFTFGPSASLPLGGHAPFSDAKVTTVTLTGGLLALF